jgi:hypothetical protein
MNNSIPDTTNLPSWASWIAQDADGAWWAYEAEPNQQETGWYENEIGRIQAMGHGEPNPNWQNSLVRLAPKTGQKPKNND